jgi:hypothetical protein
MSWNSGPIGLRRTSDGPIGKKESRQVIWHRAPINITSIGLISIAWKMAKMYRSLKYKNQ